MLSRRFLRVKVFQALYAYFQGEGDAVQKGEKELFRSIDRSYDLYVFFLLLPVELSAIARRKQEEARDKRMPTEEDLNPNTKFVDNRLIGQLEASSLPAVADKRKVSWQADQDELKKFLRFIREQPLYENYMSSDQDSYKSDKTFLIKLFRELVPDFELIFSRLQERSIYWSLDDVDYALGMVVKTVRKMKENKAVELASLWKDKEDDQQFVKDLYRKTIRYNEENSEVISENIKNWEIDRVAVIDKVLMKMAITELTQFQSIPVKVTLNEYIELAKWYSSPKSKVFINGILDKIVADYKESGKIKKTGRGLMEH